MKKIRFKTLNRVQEKAYHIWIQQRLRMGVEYGRDEFIAWYEVEFRKKKWTRAHVARFDHDKPYSFANIEMQEQAENNRERNARRGNPGKSHKRVYAFLHGKRKVFVTKKEAAIFYGLDAKTIYNRCMGRTKSPGKFGPRSNDVIFEWADA